MIHDGTVLAPTHPVISAQAGIQQFGTESAQIVVVGQHSFRPRITGFPLARERREQRID
jgi:hypothetical protein